MNEVEKSQVRQTCLSEAVRLAMNGLLGGNAVIAMAKEMYNFVIDDNYGKNVGLKPENLVGAHSVEDHK